jgi:flagellar hook-basal body complex protein FliE
MSDISSINQVLAEMRRLSAAAASSPLEQSDKTQAAGADFSALLKQSIDQVNETQKAAGKLSDAFSAGDPNVDVAEVMVALQKAGVAFQAMTEVRNKLVSAYQDIMSMPI